MCNLQFWGFGFRLTHSQSRHGVERPRWLHPSGWVRGVGLGGLGIGVGPEIVILRLSPEHLTQEPKRQHHQMSEVMAIVRAANMVAQVPPDR